MQAPLGRRRDRLAAPVSQPTHVVPQSGLQRVPHAHQAQAPYHVPPYGVYRPSTMPPPYPYASHPPSPPTHQAPIAPYAASPFVPRAVVVHPSLPPYPSLRAQLDPPRGLPTFFAFVFGIVGAAVALACDVAFLHVHVPGVGGYAWYLTTAFSFMAAGYGAAAWTRAERGAATWAVVFAGMLYGAADVGLGFVLESLSLQSAVILGAQGLAIALFTGMSGAHKGLRAKR